MMITLLYSPMNEFHEFQMLNLSSVRWWWELLEPIFWKKIFSELMISWQDKEAADPGPKPVAIQVPKLHICPAMIYLELLSLLNHNTKCNY